MTATIITLTNYFFFLLLRLCLLATTTTASAAAGCCCYVNNSPLPDHRRPMFDDDHDGAFHRGRASSSSSSSSSSTREKKFLHWPSAGLSPVPVQKEVDLLQSGTLVRRGEFGPLRNSRALEVELECAELDGIDYSQAESIRKQLLVRKLLRGSWKLKDETTVKSIVNKFERGRRPLAEISTEYDLSPVSIFRAILAPRVLGARPRLGSVDARRPAGRIVQSIIGETDDDAVREFLSSEWELEQLRTAKENDLAGYCDNSNTVAEDWERTIYDFLDERGIEYVTEDSMRRGVEGCYDDGTDTNNNNNNNNNTRGTPDCLLLDDLYINGRNIRWIEFKSFYASGLRANSRFTNKVLSRQVRRYENEFGTNCGAVILRNGFSEGICEKHGRTMFLDGGPLYPGLDNYGP